MFLLGLGETGLVGLLIGLGGLDLELRRGRAGHCEDAGKTNERNKSELRLGKKREGRQPTRGKGKRLE